MLQRIQTVYLLLVVALIATTLFIPLAMFQQGEASFFLFDAFSISSVQADMSTPAESVQAFSTWSVAFLLAVISMTALVAVFSFKNRIRQVRMCVFNALLMLAFYGLFFFYVWKVKQQMPDVVLQVKFALALPLVSLILNYLAIRHIGADEALVRSLDRLR